MTGDDVDLVVIGGGPGGYTAAFRAADLGLRVAVVDDRPRLGGVCLHVGCIPSKTLLHAAAVITQAADARSLGIDFGEPTIDAGRLRAATAQVVGKLADGLQGLARTRKIEVVTGTATFSDPHTIAVDGTQPRTIRFTTAIVAVGSRPIRPAVLPEDPRIVDSTGALELPDIPGRLVVVGGGIIGLEMATFHAALGTQVSVVERLDRLIPGCDADLVRPLRSRLEAAGVAIHLSTEVTGVVADDRSLRVQVRTGDGTEREFPADRVLVAVGRRPNGDLVRAERAGVRVDERGFIHVDAAMRTNVPHILAIGDVTGDPMLAHRAAHQGRVAAEVAAGRDEVFDALAVPSVAYTDPEVAWAGLTESDAGEVPYELATIPWAASGRALGIGRPEGRTKLLIDPESRRILGAGIVGPQAGELIGELVLAIEMGAVAEDLARTVHPHPTLSETVALAAEWAEGTITDLYRAPTRRGATNR